MASAVHTAFSPIGVHHVTSNIVKYGDNSLG